MSVSPSIKATLNNGLSLHIAFRVISAVIGVILKSKACPSSCHPTKSYSDFVGSVGFVTLSPYNTSILVTSFPLSVSKVTVYVLIVQTAFSVIFPVIGVVKSNV